MEPTPTEVAPWYLRNINQALALDSTTGEVYLRTGITGDVIITGPVTIPGTVTVNSTPSDPVHTHVSEVGTSGLLTIPNMPISIQNAAGNANSNTYPVYVSGSVNIGTMPEVEIKNDSGNPVPINGTVTSNQGTSPWVVSGNVNATIQGTPIVSLPSNSSDAFGRLRVSNPYTVYDTQARYYDHEQFSSNISGTASVIYNANSSTFELNVSTGSGDSVQRETTKTFPYQPGKSLLILHTFCMSAPKANLLQRAGYFGANNGIFFEVAGTTLNMVIRSKSTGTIVEDRIPQSSWNGDRLNGAGGANNPSGITLNPALDQIWFCDIEWLGVGSVRVGFVINGAYYTCHTFNHANTISTPTTDNTTTYMSTATLPLRYEITNTGVTSSPSLMRQICSSVISEGGFQLSGSGNPRAASHVIGAPITLPNDVSFKPVMAIRLKSTMLDAVVVPINYSLVPVAQSMFQYRIYKRAITSGGTWVDSATDSAVQYNLSPTALVSGKIAEQSFINSTNQSSSAPVQQGFGFEYQLEREPFTGVPYEYVITMATTGQNQDVYVSLEWQEIS